MRYCAILGWVMIGLIAPWSESAAEVITWKATGTGGAVAAGKMNSVAAGIQILEDGGNAADAAAATLLALSVTDYGSFAIGGEIPLIIYDAKQQRVKVLCGLGSAPLDPNAIDWFYENGIPAKGSMKSAPVPGAVDLCVTALKVFGTMSFEQVVQPTLTLLDAGLEQWHRDLTVTMHKLVERERETNGSREAKLTAVRDRFYKGDIADELEAWYIETGALLRKSDLAAHVTRIEDPVSVTYRGYTIYKCGPWTQGPYLCQTLRLLEGFDLKEMGHLSPDYIHVVIESLKLAMADRDEYYGDPRFVKVPLKQLLSDEYTKLRQSLIDMNHASLDIRPGDPYGPHPIKGQAQWEDSTANIPVQDTTTCLVADRWGNVVAATPSCNLAGNKPGPSGVTQGNRVRSLNTTRGHPNRVQPGKRPRITLTPTLVLKDGKPVVAISVAGGDLQDQTTLNLLLNHIDFGMLPEQAVTAPRFNTFHHQDSFDPNPDRSATFQGAGRMQVNERIPEAIRKELTQRGHRVQTTKGPIANPIMIYIDHKNGVFHAAGDPKAGRHAAALK
ncbi:MAG: gamma-glutamyltransferase [Planctomycetes bacterium]|nr:gamma-glutamyltransferase [Planctomycetota bacterium]